MAWGRKTHLKKWGVLYKSYRCRHMFQPKSSPPPYRMQIYMLQDHDRDISKGEEPTSGLALVQILSLQDAPLRRSRTGIKRDAAEMEECDLEDEDDYVEGNNGGPGGSQLLSPAGSHMTPTLTMVGVFPPCQIPKTPGGVGAAMLPASAASSINSKLVTPAAALGGGAGGASTSRGGRQASGLSAAAIGALSQDAKRLASAPGLAARSPRNKRTATAVRCVRVREGQGPLPREGASERDEEHAQAPRQEACPASCLLPLAAACLPLALRGSACLAPPRGILASLCAPPCH